MNRLPASICRNPLAQANVLRVIGVVATIFFLSIPSMGHCTRGWQQLKPEVRIQNNKTAITTLSTAHKRLILASSVFVRASRSKRSNDTCSNSTQILEAIDNLVRVNKQYADCLIPQNNEKLTELFADSIKYLSNAKNRVQQVLYDKRCSTGIQTGENTDLPTYIKWITLLNNATRESFALRNTELNKMKETKSGFSRKKNNTRKNNLRPRRRVGQLRR